MENRMTPEQRKQVIELSQDATMKTTAIAKIVGVTKNAVCGVRKRAMDAGLLERRLSMQALQRMTAAVRPRRNDRRTPAERAIMALDVTKCCWPIGDPKIAGFHFCNEAALHRRRKPRWCDKHIEAGYHKTQQRKG
jgi:hypothetical protein